MNARKAKLLRRAVQQMKEAGHIKTDGYARRADTGAVVARGARGVYQRLKKVVK